MRTDEIEIRGRLIQELFEDTFHNLFIRNIYIYIYWNYWNWKIYINHRIINKMEEKKISHVKYDNQVFFSVFFSYLNSQSHDEVFFYDK